MAFTTALIGAGSIVQERQAGLPDRLATFPGPKFSGLIGRVFALSTIALISVAVAIVAGLILGAEYGSFLAFLR
ncbi:hypothetical protein [Trueperella bonasi]|nr:hypothetical protein [Trueperella bonasi]